MKGLAGISRMLYYKRYELALRKTFPYKTLEVLGPEHEFSLVNSEMKPMPIVEKVINEYYGRIANFICLPKFAFRTEFPLHIIELKAANPFKSPQIFEEIMQNAIATFLDFVGEKYHAQLLGTGMHPLLYLKETGLLPCSEVAKELRKIFPLARHGWLNLQSFQLNLPYSTEDEAILLYNALINLCTYLPALSASSPICEGHLIPYVDFRLYHYKIKSLEVPSVAGDVVPEHIFSFNQFRNQVSDVYLRDLANAGVSTKTFVDYINQRAVVLKFARKAVEMRVMDEQECIKSDVALSCFVSSTIRGLMAINTEILPHQLLVNDYNSIIENGLEAEVQHFAGKTARQVCQYFFNLASKYANETEKKYLWIVKKRIKEGNLSDLIRRRVLNKAQRTTFEEAIISVYSKLAECLSDNQPYF